MYQLILIQALTGSSAGAAFCDPLEEQG